MSWGSKDTRVMNLVFITEADEATKKTLSLSKEIESLYSRMQKIQKTSLVDEESLKKDIGKSESFLRKQKEMLLAYENSLKEHLDDLMKNKEKLAKAQEDYRNKSIDWSAYERERNELVSEQNVIRDAIKLKERELRGLNLSVKKETDTKSRKELMLASKGTYSEDLAEVQESTRRTVSEFEKIRKEADLTKMSYTELREWKNRLARTKSVLPEESEGYKTLNAQYSKVSDYMKILNEKYQTLHKNYKLESESLENLALRIKQLRDIRKTLDPTKDASEISNVNVELGKLVKQQERVNNEYDRLEKGQSKFEYGFRKWSNSLNNFQMTFPLIAAGIYAVVSLVKNFVGEMSELSDQLSNIKQTTGLSTEEVRQLNGEITKLFTRTENSTLRGLAEMSGQFGISRNQILATVNALDKGTVVLGKYFGEGQGGAEKMAEMFFKIRTNIGELNSKNVGDDLLKIGNAINYLSNQGVAAPEGMADIINRISATLSARGLTAGQIFGLAASTQEVGMNIEQGSTAILRVFNKMLTNIEEFARVSGMKLTDFKNLVNNDIYTAFQKVLEGINKNKGASTELATIFGNLEADGAGAMTFLDKMSAYMSKMKERTDWASEGLKNANTILQSFEDKNQNLAGNLEIIWKKIKSQIFYNIIPQTFVGAFEKGVKVIADLVKETKYFSDELVTQKNEMNSLILSLQNTKKGTFEYKQILSEINQLYPDVLKGLNLETLSYTELAKSLEKVNKEKQLEIELQKKKEIYETNVDESNKLQTQLTVVEKKIGEVLAKYIGKAGLKGSFTKEQLDVVLQQEYNEIFEDYSDEIVVLYEKRTEVLRQLSLRQKAAGEASFLATAKAFYQGKGDLSEISTTLLESARERLKLTKENLDLLGVIESELQLRSLPQRPKISAEDLKVIEEEKKQMRERTAREFAENVKKSEDAIEFLNGKIQEYLTESITATREHELTELEVWKNAQKRKNEEKAKEILNEKQRSELFLKANLELEEAFIRKKADINKKFDDQLDKERIERFEKNAKKEQEIRKKLEKVFEATSFSWQEKFEIFKTLENDPVFKFLSKEDKDAFRKNLEKKQTEKYVKDFKIEEPVEKKQADFEKNQKSALDFFKFLYDEAKISLLEYENYKNSIEKAGVDMHKKFEEEKLKATQEVGEKEKLLLSEKLNLYKNAISILSETVYNFASGNEASFKKFGINLIKLALDFLENYVTIAIAGTTIQGLATLDPTALIRIALIKGIFAGIKGAITAELEGAEQGGTLISRKQDGKLFFAQKSRERGLIEQPTALVGEAGKEYVIPSRVLTNLEGNFVGKTFLRVIETSRVTAKPIDFNSVTKLQGFQNGGFVNHYSQNTNNNNIDVLNPVLLNVLNNVANSNQLIYETFRNGLKIQSEAYIRQSVIDKNQSDISEIRNKSMK